MVAKHLEKLEHLAEAAQMTGVRVIVSKVWKGRDGKWCARFVIRPIGDKFRLIRENPWNGRRRKVWAVCLHGHAEFMHNLFQLSPKAEIFSAMARVNAENLLSVELELRDRNIGSRMFPFYYGDACDC